MAIAVGRSALYAGFNLESQLELIRGQSMTTLRQLAEAATPGPWAWDDDCVSEDYDTSQHAPWLCTENLDTAVMTGEIHVRESADASYIAAANPTAILALLDTIDAQRKALSHFTDVMQSIATGNIQSIDSAQNVAVAAIAVHLEATK